MQAQGRVAYYLLTGSLMGLGIADYVSIGLPVFLLGLTLALYGSRRMGPGGFWLTLVGMGAAPALLLLYYRLAPNDSSLASTDTSLYIALIFLLVALVGVAWGVVEGRNRHSKPGSQA